MCQQSSGEAFHQMMRVLHNRLAPRVVTNDHGSAGCQLLVDGRNVGPRKPRGEWLKWANGFYDGLVECAHMEVSHP